MRELKGDYAVNQHNILIESHRTKMTPQQQKIFLAFVSLVDSRNDEDFMLTQISVKQFAEILALEDPNYKQIRDGVHKMVSITFQNPITDETDSETNDPEDFEVINLFEKIRYRKKLGVIEAKFHQDLKPFLLQLENHYTTYDFEEVRNLTSSYAIRLYELAMQWQGSKEKKFKHEIENLKLMFGATTNSYKEYSNFKLKVLKVAHDEINGKTNLKLDYKEIKSGRKVVAIEFSIKQLPTRKKKRNK